MAAFLPSAKSVALEFEAPEEFYELPLNLPETALDQQVTELAAQIWKNGTDFQRKATAACYRDIVDALSTDGVLYAALGLFSTEDKRVSVANLIMRIEETEHAQPEVACAAIHEMLSLAPHRDVHRVELNCGPAVVSFHALEFTTKESGQGIPFIQIELYVPSPGGEYLVVFAMSTPSLAELPNYVSLMSQVGESVIFTESFTKPASNPRTGSVPQQGDTGPSVADAFG